MSQKDNDDAALSQPWGASHVGMKHLSKPASDIERMEGIGWGYDPDKTAPQVDGKATKALEQEELETLTYLSEGERETTSIEKVLATMAGDMVGLAYRTDFMRSSIGVKGKGRESIHKITAGNVPKVSVPTTMQKVRRVLTGRGGKKQGEEEETSYGYEEDR